jgi:hypothetical protein
MDTASSFGPSFGLGVLLPVTLLLAIPLVVAVWRIGNTPARFVLIALWLRYMAGAYHLYMFKPVAAGLSGNALLSILVTGIGLVLIVRPANLALRWLLPMWLLIGLTLLSAMLNGDPMGAVDAVVKYLYFLVIAIATYQALRRDDGGRMVGWLMVAFLPLIVLQMLSLALVLPKGSEAGDGLVWIGGYNHEGAFSVALFAGFVVACFARGAPALLRFMFLMATLVVIQLAGYRTAILALAPLAGATFWVGMTTSVRREQRMLVAAAGGILAATAIGMAAILYGDRFADIAVLLADPGSFIKPPREFTFAERQLLSARAYIWSSYIFAWAAGEPWQYLFGMGPGSWEGLFKVYPHNTLVAMLYELGFTGVAVIVLLWAVMTLAAWRAQGERLKLVAAHISFVLLNMATMPFWQVEGLGLYGFLCGYTMYRAGQARRRISGFAPPSRTKSGWPERKWSTATRQPS